MNTTHTNEPIEKKEKLKAGRLLDELDLRDYFAAKAMVAYWSDPTVTGEFKTAAAWAYDMADAMLKARAA